VPLYEESIDNIVGILHLRDVVAGLDRRPMPSARSLAKPPVFVPDTKPLPPLLRQFQAQHQQMAIAVDEYGGTAGLVTVEDLLEEIVGEIMDEHEAGEAPQQALPDGGWRLSGSSPIETLHDLFGVNTEALPSETVGGLVFAALGELPEAGRETTIQGLRFRVERVGARRIRTLSVHRHAESE
jgi:CBS domain containing-hemolysin-like protein